MRPISGFARIFSVSLTRLSELRLERVRASSVPARSTAKAIGWEPPARQVKCCGEALAIYGTKLCEAMRHHRPSVSDV